MIKRLHCLIDGCSCRGLGEFIIDVNMDKDFFALPDMYCAECLGKLNFVVDHEEMIMDSSNPIEVENA